MDLLQYLIEHFYTEQQLIKHADIDLQTLQLLQQKKCMPVASYQVQGDLNCQSFFGEHHVQQSISFYAKGYVAWIQQVKDLSEQESFIIFSQQYSERVTELLSLGFKVHDFMQQDQLDSVQLQKHIQEEWHHFLQGTYGVCTTTGLAKEIADKEVAICVIDAITAKQTKLSLTVTEQALLNKAIALLDHASALFAPHERAKSSRNRCIDAVRQLYQL